VLSAYAERLKRQVNGSLRQVKTRDRILEAARNLFNHEGAGRLSAVDIASAMGISAGHLYYHFKGKPQILAELMEAHAAEVLMVLGAAAEACQREPALEILWTHIHILVEEAWDARFFYREPALAMENLAVGHAARRILSSQHATLFQCLEFLRAAGSIAGSVEASRGLGSQMSTLIGFHAISFELIGEPGSEKDRVARAAAQIMMPVGARAI
jgi:AcrR family transcriptional regulator